MGKKSSKGQGFGGSWRLLGHVFELIFEEMKKRGLEPNVIPESALASLEVMEQKSSGKRFSVFRGGGIQELKGAGGMSRMGDFNARS